MEYTTDKRTGNLVAQQTVALTTDDIKALRAADAVSFFHRDGTPSIVATKRDEGDIFGYAERSREIPIHASRVTNYANEAPAEAEHAARYGWSCLYYLSTAQMCETWRTIAELLKLNDVLTFQWYRANNTLHMDELGIAHDMLRLDVQRGKKTYTFHVAASITERTSMGRMVRLV